MTEPSRDVLLARAAWSRLVEPGDAVAGAVVAALGPVEALTWVRSCEGHDPAGPVAQLGMDPRLGRRLQAAVARWLPRLETLDARREVAAHERLGGLVVGPESRGWPSGLDDLGPAAPLCLWVSGEPDLAHVLRGSVALVGSRAATGYGEHVTAELAAGLADGGRAVVSGGAYGIDAVAHRGALSAGGPTVAVLAGGVDRLYPAGNAPLLASVAEGGGALVSEVPPGSVPSRSRFLQRNRLIAAMADATVVVEAAWRSGALSTAAHAASLLRPVGAVPGPVTSSASAGCHRLLRDGAAVCVTDVGEVLELVTGAGAGVATAREADEASARPTDGLDELQLRTFDALPVRRWASEPSLVRAAGASTAEVRGALGVLLVRGLAVRDGGRWRRAPLR